MAFAAIRKQGTDMSEQYANRQEKRTAVQTAEYPGIKDAGRKCFGITRILDEQTVKDILYTAEKQEKNNDANQQRH